MVESHLEGSRHPGRPVLWTFLPDRGGQHCSGKRGGRLHDSNPRKVEK